MNEKYIEKNPLTELEETPLDMSDVRVERIDEADYLFHVPDRTIGRKIGLEVIKSLPKWAQEMAKQSLTKSNKIDDLRLDGNQLSFSEYENNEDPIVRIYIRNISGNSEGVDKLNTAILKIINTSEIPME